MGGVRLGDSDNTEPPAAVRGGREVGKRGKSALVLGHGVLPGDDL